MRKGSLFVVVLLSLLASAQVISPPEIKDPDLRALQQQYMDDLKQLGADIVSIPTEYSFYLSRRLDIDEAQQKASDQRSIRFDRYQGKTILEVTGNYYVAYSAEKITPEQRSKQTFDSIILPILKVEVPRFQKNANIQAYAFEISHHVVGKVMGVAMERPENLLFVLPQQSAIRLVGAKEENVRQAALLQGETYLNGKPVTIWLSGEGPQLAAQDTAPTSEPAAPSTNSAEAVRGGEEKTDSIQYKPIPKTLKPVEPPVPTRDTSSAALASLQAANKETLASLVKELDSQAHFVSYAAPSFVAFRKGVYLELSINTSLAEPASVSRYRLAALTFDDHLSHLIRPVLGYFKDDSQFDGIGFSSNVHLTTKTSANPSTVAVEFFFPFKTLRCYETYDCTGQQLIDSGTVLINGERVGLDLQVAESSGAK
jgi:hypothetical protein